MLNTKLFVAKIPKLHNGNFKTSSIRDVGGNISGRKWEYFDFIQKDNSLSFDNTAIPVMPMAFASSGTDGKYLAQDIGANAGKYTIEVDIEVIDETQVYDGVICLGIGSSFKYLETPGDDTLQDTTKHTVTHNLPGGSFVTSPGKYIMYYTVNDYQLGDPCFGNKLNITTSGNAFRVGNPIDNIGISKIAIRNFEPYNYKQLDLYDDIDIPITYNVADVRDISQKDSNYSFDVSLPNTNNNAQFFSHIHNVTDFDSTFEMLNPYPCFIEKDGNRVFEGFMRMREVETEDNTFVSYTVDLYSNIVEFFNQLGDQTLVGNDDSFNDLDFSYYKQTMSTTNVHSLLCEERPIINGTVQPWGFTLINKWGRMVDNSCFNVHIEELTPFLYVKDIVDKIFEKTSYTYVSDFLTNSIKNNTGFDFTEIVYPRTKSTIVKRTDYESNVYQLSISSPYQENSHVDFTAWRAPSPLAASTYADVGSCYANTLGQLSATDGNHTFSPNWVFTAPIRGAYHIDVKIPFLFNAILTYANGTAKWTTLTGSVDGRTEMYSIIKFKIFKTGQSTPIISQSFTENYQSSYTITNAEIPLIDDVFEGSADVILNAGEALYMQASIMMPEIVNSNGEYTLTVDRGGGVTDAVGQWARIWFPAGTVGTKEYTANDDEFINVSLHTDFVLGADYDPTEVLDSTVKKSDFITSLIKKFNLYIEDISNKYLNHTWYGENTLRIEPRNMYYELDDTVVDLTKCVDTSSLKIKRLDEYVQKKIILNDKYDEEYYTKDYKDNTYNVPEYGEKIIYPVIPENDPEEVEISTIFGQTMSPVTGNYYKAVQMPSLLIDGTGDKQFSPRIMFVHNYDMTSSSYNRPYHNEAIYVYNSLAAFSNIPSSAAAVSFANDTKYNLIDHFNYPFSYTPTGKVLADLNFGWPNWYYQYNASFIWNNAYNRFYSSMVDDYNNQNSRMLTCEMYIDSYTISGLCLSNTILVNSVAYRINKIEEWTNENEPCKVELVRILDSTSEPSATILVRNNQLRTQPVPQSIVNANVNTTLTEQNSAIKDLNSSLESNLATINKQLQAITTLISNLDDRVTKLEQQ